MVNDSILPFLFYLYNKIGSIIAVNLKETTN
ncbi:hypothetical protein SAMN05444407_109111 [Chryseobacterium contaminans]|uniref:Uncharacterized protein n=1 Tax=Chryseobacterium contaminans TaxID=1423959 RepID=A0A1M7FYX5_9FLAO|nr:hypothetical protein SAMN05444407_109111 [Chryseobacterium contaminans]